MIEPISGWAVLGMAMQLFGDIMAVFAVFTAGMVFLGEVILDAPTAKTTGFWTSSIMLTVISIIGLVGKYKTDLDYPNGFIFAFSDFAIVLLLLLAILLLVGTVVISRIR